MELIVIIINFSSTLISICRLTHLRKEELILKCDYIFFCYIHIHKNTYTYIHIHIYRNAFNLFYTDLIEYAKYYFSIDVFT